MVDINALDTEENQMQWEIMDQKLEMKEARFLQFCIVNDILIGVKAPKSTHNLRVSFYGESVWMSSSYLIG